MYVKTIISIEDLNASAFRFGLRIALTKHQDHRKDILVDQLLRLVVCLIKSPTSQEDELTSSSDTAPS